MITQIIQLEKKHTEVITKTRVPTWIIITLKRKWFFGIYNNHSERSFISIFKSILINYHLSNVFASPLPFWSFKFVSVLMLFFSDDFAYFGNHWSKEPSMNFLRNFPIDSFRNPSGGLVWKFFRRFRDSSNNFFINFTNSVQDSLGYLPWIFSDISQLLFLWNFV